jgi:hypothetical protein
MKQGKYSVQLIHAETKEAFHVHTAPNGETYVEVEPDAEYFIRVATDSEEIVKVEISVDGKSLGYYFPFSKADSTSDKGLWRYENGKSYDIALKFAKAPVREATNGSTPPVFWTGKVDVKVSEAIQSGYVEMPDFSSTWNGGDVGYVMGISDPDKKKGVISDKGTQFEVTKSKRRRVTFKTGGLLATITLRYCSTLGLIHAGVLPKPPMWDLHRKLNPRDSDEPKAEPTKLVTLKNENGGQVEVLDLTDN